jgi:uncharacterized damage-inducible protein DinB
MPEPRETTLARHRTVFDRNLRLLERTVDGISDDAASAPLVAGGSNLHWLLAHLVVSRDGLLARVGGQRVWDAEAAEAFGRGSLPTAEAPATIKEQLARLREQQARLDAVLERLDDDDLGREAGPMTVAGWIEFLAWHETYHLGQATLYRRAAGLPSAVG